MNNSGQGSVVLQDSAAVPLQNLKIFGWSTQDGTPSPENPVPIVSAGEGGSINITVSDGADQSQSFSIQTPNGLPGIPVESGGNYTDASGQQWACDYKDYKNEVYIKILTLIPDLSIGTFTTHQDGMFICDLANYSAPNANTKTLASMCTHFPTTISQDSFGIVVSSKYVIIGAALAGTFDSVDDFNSLLLEQSENNTPVQLLYYHNETIEIPLSPDEIAAFQALTAYSPTTTITNDANAWMWVQYLLESEMSPWFYPKTEIGLYYKAYAGYETELPAPTCRETKLIKKLLDSSYQLDFEVTERSSRTEKYLWDLISKTNTMLANIPKTDTEKFLHMLLGGEVTEYPIIDCERNYWMSKCVEQ